MNANDYDNDNDNDDVKTTSPYVYFLQCRNNVRPTPPTRTVPVRANVAMARALAPTATAAQPATVCDAFFCAA